MANRVGILSDGRLAVEGSVEEILNNFGTNSVEVQFSAEDTASVEALRTSGAFGSVDYYEKTLLAVCNAANAEAGMSAAMRILADRSAAVSGVKLARPTLEQVYLKINGGVEGVE